MKPQSFSKKPQDPSVLCAWRQQVVQASEDSNARQRLLLQAPEMLPRFNDHYAKLKALPRRARRALQRQWKRSLAGVALLLALGQAPALAATINVGGGCSLVDAITAANTNTATGGCSKGGGADRIVLPPNSTQRLTAVNNNNPDEGPTGLPIISSAIAIDGNRSTIRRIASAPEFRIFTVERGARLTLMETRVTGGAASNVGETENGGGGLLNRGVISLTHCVVADNRAENGGAVTSAGADTRLIITNSTISGNTAIGGNAGGVEVYAGSAQLTNSTISGNTAGTAGGGLANIAATLDLGPVHTNAAHRR